MKCELQRRESLRSYQLGALYTDSILTSDGQYLCFRKTLHNPLRNRMLRQEILEQGFSCHPKFENFFIYIAHTNRGAPEVAEYFLFQRTQTRYERLQKEPTDHRHPDKGPIDFHSLNNHRRRMMSQFYDLKSRRIHNA